MKRNGHHVPHDLDSEVERAIAQAAVQPQIEVPGAEEPQITATRVHVIIDQIADTALNELTTLRDRIDDQIRAIKAHRDYAKGVIDHQARFAKEVISVKLIVSDAVERITGTIEQAMAAPVSRTVTTNGADAH